MREFLILLLPCLLTSAQGGDEWTLAGGPPPPSGPRFEMPEKLTDGRIEIRFEPHHSGSYLIQATSNFVSWTDLGFAAAQDGSVAFSEREASAARRFYRAEDITGALRVNGVVVNTQTEEPIPGASVSLGVLGGMVTTGQADAEGRFHLFFRSPDHPGTLLLIANAAGFSPFSVERDYTSDQHAFEIPVLLSPPDYRPPNDDFANREMLAGTNVSVAAYTLGATKELSEPASMGGGSLWWSWTAARDGAAMVEAEIGGIRPSLSVYSGENLHSLAEVWRSGPEAGQSFIVAAGKTYHIALDSGGAHGKAQVRISLVEPQPPQIEVEPVSISAVAGSMAVFRPLVSGTDPISYRWFKDGIPVSTNSGPSLALGPIQSWDEGSYSLMASNAAGFSRSAEARLFVLPKFLPPSTPQELRRRQFALIFVGKPTRELVLTNDVTYELRVENEIFTGSYSVWYNGNTQWVIAVDPSRESSLNPVGTYMLNFTQDGAGWVVFSPGSAGELVYGSFSRFFGTFPANSAPAEMEELMASSYLIRTTQDRILRLISPSDYELTSEEGIQRGSFSAHRQHNQWTLSLAPTGGGVSGTARLVFAAPNSGLWSLTLVGGKTEEGTFLGVTGGGLELPGFLTGYMLQLFYMAAGWDQFDFTSSGSGFFDQNPSDTITYEWDPNARRISIERGSPPDFWHVELAFAAGSSNQGNFTANVNNTALTGNFQLLPQ